MENLTAFAKYRGVLELNRANVDCYVSENELRLVSIKGAWLALAQEERGDGARLWGLKPLEAYISAGSMGARLVLLTLPGTTTIAKCLTHDTFLELCGAYLQAMVDGNLITDRQKRIAKSSRIILSACAKIGLMALIDEATGYQQHRADNALQVKIQAYILDELRGWEKAFPDELWEKFGRLTNWDKPLQHRPKYWGKLVYELIYDALDPDVAEYLKTNKPNPKYKQNWHQWLSKDFGAKALHIHINQVVGIAKTCDTIVELKEKVAHLFKNKPFQMRV